MEDDSKGPSITVQLPDLVEEVREALRLEFAAGLTRIQNLASKETVQQPPSEVDEKGACTSAVASNHGAAVRETVRAEVTQGLQQICGWLGVEEICELVRRKLEDESGEEDDEEPRCPGGHPLRAGTTPHGNFCCDKCKADVPMGTVLWGCRRCNYDLCQSCCGRTAEFAPPMRDPEDSNDSESDDSWGDGDDIAPEDARKLIICVRGDIGMSIGKTAAQVGHAVHHAVRHSTWQDLQAWEACGSKKVTLKADSQAHLLELRKAARDAGLVAESIRDAGHTELEPGTMTVLAVGPALDTRIDPITGHLKPVPDNLRRENEKLKEKNAKVQEELETVRREKKQIRQDKLSLLEQLRDAGRYRL